MTKYHFTYGLPSQVEFLDQDLPRVERFYKAALERDQVLIERAVEKTLSSGRRYPPSSQAVSITPGDREVPSREGHLLYSSRPAHHEEPLTRKRKRALRRRPARNPLPIEKVLSETLSPTQITGPERSAVPVGRQAHNSRAWIRVHATGAAFERLTTA